MGKFLQGTLKGLWRVAGPIALGALGQYATENPYVALGLVGVSKVIIPGVKQYYKDHGKEVPGWVVSLPF